MSNRPTRRSSVAKRPAKIAAPRHPTSSRRASAILAAAGSITLYDSSEEVISIGDDEGQPGDVEPVMLNVSVDEYLRQGKEWGVKIMAPPGPDATPEEKVEWARGAGFKNMFGREQERDGREHRRLDGRYKRDATFEGMQKVRRIELNGETYTDEDIVVIRPSRGDEKWTNTIRANDPDKKRSAVHPKNSWIAQILELRVRGGKMLALVVWLYWPADLRKAHGKGESESPKDGRKGYHGDYELVVSNHLDIMDVNTFDRVFTDKDLSVCKEIDGELLKKYYWRQSYDVRDGSLSELPRYCKCNRFWKPDTPLLQCPSDTCSKWLHPECVIGDVLLEEWKGICRENGRGGKIGRAKTGPKGDRNSAFVDHSRWKHRLEGRMNDEGTKVVVLHKRGGEDNAERWYEEEVGIRCLFCAVSFIEEVKEE